MAVTTIYVCAYSTYIAPFRAPSPASGRPAPPAALPHRAGGEATTLVQAMDNPPWDVYYALGIRPGGTPERTVS
jgi:hypothetical protein